MCSVFSLKCVLLTAAVAVTSALEPQWTSCDAELLDDSDDDLMSFSFNQPKGMYIATTRLLALMDLKHKSACAEQGQRKIFKSGEALSPLLLFLRRSRSPKVLFLVPIESAKSVALPVPVIIAGI